MANLTLKVDISQLPERIVFFDGYCHLCNGSVSFIIRHNPEKNLRYAPLSSETARQVQENLNSFNWPDSIVLYDKGRLYFESAAALRLAGHLSFPYRIISLLRIIPPVITNYFYRLIARNRYRWFGKSETCRMPTLEERNLFLP